MCVNETEADSKYSNCTVEEQCSCKYLDTQLSHRLMWSSCVYNSFICWPASTIYISMCKYVNKPFASSLNIWYAILKYTILLCIQLTAYCSCFKKPDVLLDTCLWLLPWFLRLKWVTFPIRYSISKIHLSPLLHVRCSKQENLMNLPVLIVN